MKIWKNLYPPASEASMEVANLTEIKNPSPTYIDECQASTGLQTGDPTKV